MTALGEWGLPYAAHEGQLRAFASEARFVAVFAGTQGGKTSFGPAWLFWEMVDRGPGDYMIVTPTFPLLELKCLPEFKALFERALGLGRYLSSPIRRFEFSEAGKRLMVAQTGDKAWLSRPTVVYFGTGNKPESVESATAKAVWMDEAGQKQFKLSSWDAIQRRLSIAQGRALFTTTPYTLGWLKQQIWDRRDDPGIDVIRFESIMNPAFPAEEFARMQTLLPPWKFNMFYRGLFTRPAGMIYDCFDEDIHLVDPFPIPQDWPRFLGLDFGGVNTAGVFIAKRPKDGHMFLYKEYHAGSRTAAQHAKELMKGEQKRPTAVGGAASEDHWRREFYSAGLPVQPPRVKDVEVGIDRVYGVHAENKMSVFRNLPKYRDQKMSYARELDDNDEPTEKIDNKENYHVMDAERYIMSYLASGYAGKLQTRKGALK